MSSQRTKLQQFSWALFDFANSAFPTVITTFVFAAYFSKGIVGDEVLGTSLWGYATGIAAFFIAICAPIFGAIADHSGDRKRWIFLFSLLCIAGSSLLWFGTPDQSSIMFVLICVGVATFGFEMAMVFYNAMLPQLAPKTGQGRLSGWAWGLGYFGGLLCLALTLVLFVQAETPFFGLDKATAEHLRITGPFVGLWYLIFALPLFLFVQENSKAVSSLSSSVRQGFETLKDTLSHWKNHRDVFRFLIARMIYTDGLNTLFAFGGIYAAGTFGMEFSELIIFGIGINVTAGLGAAVFGWLDDKWGPKRVIIISLICLSVVAVGTLLVSDKTHFLVLGLLLGVFVGPTQAASRTYLALAAPEKIRTEMFGLYALSGKATAFLGPVMVAFFTDMFMSQRAGMATIVGFLLIGLALFVKLPDKRNCIQF